MREIWANWVAKRRPFGDQRCIWGYKYWCHQRGGKFWHHHPCPWYHRSCPCNIGGPWQFWWLRSQIPWEDGHLCALMECDHASMIQCLFQMSGMCYICVGYGQKTMKQFFGPKHKDKPVGGLRICCDSHLWERSPATHHGRVRDTLWLGEGWMLGCLISALWWAWYSEWKVWELGDFVCKEQWWLHVVVGTGWKSHLSICCELWQHQRGVPFEDIPVLLQCRSCGLWGNWGQEI